MADESETITSATLRFPFQASLDGSAVIEFDGCLYYGRDFSQNAAELPAQACSTVLGLGLEAVDEEDEQQQQQQQQQQRQATTSVSRSEITLQPPGEDSLGKMQDGQIDIKEGEDMPPRLVLDPTHLDQERRPSDLEVVFTQQEAEYNEVACKSSSTIMQDEIEAGKESSIRICVSPSIEEQQFAPVRYYGTPLIENDLTTTPVAMYGLEKPSDYVSKKKTPVLSKQRANPSRPQHQYLPLHHPSPLSSTVNHEEVSEGQVRMSAISATGVSRPTTIGSISSFGSSATTATIRSTVSTVSNVSAATSISSSSSSHSPIMVGASQKPVDLQAELHTTTDQIQSLESSSTNHPQPLRRTTDPISSCTATEIPRNETRRNTVSNIFTSMSSEKPSRIRPVTTSPDTNNTHALLPLTSLVEQPSPISANMPFSPDSFAAMHTPNVHSNNNTIYHNPTSFSQVHRPLTAPHGHSASSSTQYQVYTEPNQPTPPQPRKAKKQDHQHQNRATRLFTKIIRI